jgi:hypothetical protein
MPDSTIKLLYRVRGQTYMMSVSELRDFAAQQDFKEAAYLDRIDADGATFATDNPFDLGTTLEIRIELPDGGEGIRGMARILRVSEDEDGGRYTVDVSLLNISQESQARILDCLKSHPK